MRIAIFGTGGVGGYFGGRLAQAGHEVTFVARREHLAAIKSNGLRVNSIKGDFCVQPAAATDQPRTIGEVDLVLCCVKTWQVEDVAHAIGPVLGPGTTVIPLQNGVESHATLSRVIGSDKILPGLCRILSRIGDPGQILHEGAEPYIAFGEADGKRTSRVEEIARVLASGQGVSVEVSKDIIAAIWKKFMLIAPWSGLGAITRSPVGVFRTLPETRAMLLDSFREVFAVGCAMGVALTEEDMESAIALLDGMPAQGIASMQRDIMAGRPSELHEQCGAVVRLGEKTNTPTPLNRLIYHSLLPLEQRARNAISF